MADGFRKSLFGFNCGDVISYVKQTHKEFSEKETALKANVSELESSLAAANRKLSDANDEIADLKKQLKEFTDKKDELQRIAEQIGKLYIVSQANARAIMENAEESRRIASDEISRNLSSIEQAHNSLKEIMNGVRDTSENFTERVDTLSDELNTAKERLAARERDSAEKRAEYDSAAVQE